KPSFIMFELRPVNVVCPRNQDITNWEIFVKISCHQLGAGPRFVRNFLGEFSTRIPKPGCDTLVAQAFQPAGSRDFPVPFFWSGTGDWKPNVGLRVTRTRRQECLRYVAWRRPRP